MDPDEKQTRPLAEDTRPFQELPRVADRFRRPLRPGVRLSCHPFDGHAALRHNYHHDPGLDAQMQEVPELDIAYAVGTKESVRSPQASARTPPPPRPIRPGAFQQHSYYYLCTARTSP